MKDHFSDETDHQEIKESSVTFDLPHDAHVGEMLKVRHTFHIRSERCAFKHVDSIEWNQIDSQLFAFGYRVRLQTHQCALSVEFRSALQALRQLEPGVHE